MVRPIIGLVPNPCLSLYIVLDTNSTFAMYFQRIIDTGQDRARIDTGQRLCFFFLLFFFKLDDQECR